MCDLFLSHNWGSQDVVHKMADLLSSNNGYQIWLDVDSMYSGDILPGEIKQGIDNCKLFVAFITKKYCESKICQLEINYAALETKKNCLFVMLDKDLGSDPAGIGLLLAGSLRLNAYDLVNNQNWPFNLYERLSRDIKKHLTIKQPAKNLAQAQSTIKVDIPELLKLCHIDLDNYDEIKKLITQRNANVHIRDDYGYTALHFASNHGHLETVKLLIQNGANINDKDYFGFTPLMRASSNGHLQQNLETAKFLIKNGARVNESSKDGSTALIQASKCLHFVGCRRLLMVKLLVENGADVNQMAYDGNTARYWAKIRGHTDVDNYLQSKGGY